MSASAGAERGLVYLPVAAPAPGDAAYVAPGVLWMRMPLPFRLNHVNLYAISDDNGWAVVDAGLNTADTRNAWDALLTGALSVSITRVIGTHMHPDHIGLAGWLCQRSGVRLAMSRTEYLSARMFAAEQPGDAPAEGERFYRAAGWSDDQIASWRDGYGGFAKGVAPLPRAFTRLVDGDRIAVGQDRWTVVVGSGHSPEHVCLWREADDLLIAGDQLLPRISSNVSVWPTEPDADPLGDWLASLDRLERLVTEGTLVLPGHGEPFRGAPARLKALKRGHDVALKRLERTLHKPCRVIDVFPAVFGRSVGEDALSLATGEAQAHLNYLERRGLAVRTRDNVGVDWWSAAQGNQEPS